MGGQSVTGAATQRRRLGLLVVLAAAGDRGASRDRLLALLWPEATGDRARHALSQLLYSQRVDLGVGDLFLGGKTLRLNPEIVQSDVSEFIRAVESGALERAAELYRGPFLDGFHLGGGQEFERWQEAERDRLATRFTEVLERLATAATVRSDHTSAARWWRQRAALEPLNSGIAASLVRALVDSGDRAGALRHAAAHEQQLRQELGIAPDPWFQELITGMRHA